MYRRLPRVCSLMGGSWLARCVLAARAFGQLCHTILSDNTVCRSKEAMVNVTHRRGSKLWPCAGRHACKL